MIHYIQLTLEGNCAHLHYKKGLLTWSNDWNEDMADCLDCPQRITVSKICRNGIDMTPIPI